MHISFMIMWIKAMKWHLMEKSEWYLGNKFARNVVIFDGDNSSSSHSDHHKKRPIGEGILFGINGSFRARVNGLLLILVK